MSAAADVWACEDATLRNLILPLPYAIASVIAPVRAYDLPDEMVEHQDMARFHPLRRASFLSGRYCAMQAQRLLGLHPAPVTQERRMPVWGAGLCGSISHCEDVAVACVSREVKSLGIDIEVRGRVKNKIRAHILTKRERALAETGGDCFAECVFSAKEAGFKATYPLARQSIGFHDAEIHVSDIGTRRGTFCFEYVGNHGPSAAMELGHGFWKQTPQHTITVFVIP